MCTLKVFAGDLVECVVPFTIFKYLVNALFVLKDDYSGYNLRWIICSHYVQFALLLSLSIAPA